MEDRKKPKKSKYYAVHHLNTGENFVVTTWEECVAITKGHPNMYKSFPTKKEACDWLKTITPDMEALARKMGANKKRKKYYALHYTDTEENFVMTSWKRCKAMIAQKELGLAMYKSFSTPKEAFEWLCAIDYEKEEHWFKVARADTERNTKYRKRLAYYKAEPDIITLLQEKPVFVIEIKSKKIQDAYKLWQKEKENVV